MHSAVCKSSQSVHCCRHGEAHHKWPPACLSTLPLRPGSCTSAFYLQVAGYKPDKARELLVKLPSTQRVLSALNA